MDKFIELDGVSLHYTDTGNPAGKPIIIMHGYGCNVTTVRSIATILEPGMRVINVDLPGHGESDEPPEIWGVEEYTQNIEHLIEHLGLEKVSLLGHSFGGRIGILLASRHPEIHKLVLVDAAGIKPKRSLKYYFKVYTYKILKHSLPVVLGNKLGSKLLDKYRGKAGSADYKQSTPIMRGVMSKAVNTDLKSVMPAIKAPTLLIWGSEDTATPLSDAKIMNKLIPDSGLVNFDGAGHYSFLDNPGGFRAVMQEFFKNELRQD